MKTKCLAVLIVSITLIGSCRSESKAQAEETASPWGERIATVPYGHVWRVKDGAVTCYLVVNNEWTNVGQGIACLRGEP